MRAGSTLRRCGPQVSLMECFGHFSWLQPLHDSPVLPVTVTPILSVSPLLISSDKPVPAASREPRRGSGAGGWAPGGSAPLLQGALRRGRQRAPLLKGTQLMLHQAVGVHGSLTQLLKAAPASASGLLRGLEGAVRQHWARDTHNAQSPPSPNAGASRNGLQAKISPSHGKTALDNMYTTSKSS